MRALVEVWPYNRCPVSSKRSNRRFCFEFVRVDERLPRTCARCRNVCGHPAVKHPARPTLPRFSTSYTSSDVGDQNSRSVVSMMSSIPLALRCRNTSTSPPSWTSGVFNAARACSRTSRRAIARTCPTTHTANDGRVGVRDDSAIVAVVASSTEMKTTEP